MLQDQEQALNMESDLFEFDVSDESLESAAGDPRGLYCSCGGCNSACSQGSR